MKLILIITILVSLALAVKPIVKLNCTDDTLSSDIQQVISSCEVIPKLAELAPDYSLGSEKFLKMSVTSQCVESLRQLLENTVCDNLPSFQLWNAALEHLGENSFQFPDNAEVAKLLLGLRILTHLPIPTLYNPLCTDDIKAKLVTVGQFYNESCHVEEDSADSTEGAPQLCSLECNGAIASIAKNIELCREYDFVLPSDLIEKLAIMSKRCTEAEVGYNDIGQCKSVDFMNIFNAIKQICGDDPSTVSDDCLSHAEKFAPLLRRCLRVFGSNPDRLNVIPDNIITQVRDWLQNSQYDNARDLVVQMGLDNRTFVAIATNDILDGRPTTKSTIGFDDVREMFFIQVENYKDALDNMNITDEMKMRFSLSNIGWIDRAGTGIDAFDYAIDFDNLFEVQDKKYDVNATVLQELIYFIVAARDNSTDTGADVETAGGDAVQIPTIPPTADWWRQEFPLGFSEVGRAIVNHICLDRADSERFGVSTRPGVCKSVFMLRDIPHPDPFGSVLDLVLCFEVDFDMSINITYGEGPTSDIELENSDSLGDKISRRINFGDDRFEFRKWAYGNCHLGQKLEVKAKCSEPTSTTPDDGHLEGTNARTHCCFTFARESGDVGTYTTILWDFAVDHAKLQSGSS